MSIDQDLEKIALQERRLQFKHFDSGVAWACGLRSESGCGEKLKPQWPLTSNCTGFLFFRHAMAGTTPDNLEWIRRKRNVVTRYHRSSYAIGLKHERANTTLQGTTGLELKDYSDSWRQLPDFRRGNRMCRHHHHFWAAANAKTMGWWCPYFRTTCI